MIKIEDTFQEEENSQETMITSIEDSMAQRILKALDEHGEAFKKMGGCLTRLEESKLKKSTQQHIRRYLSIAEMKGLDKKQTLHVFPLSLTGGASRWYYSLDPSKTKVCNKLVELFGDQFIFNTMIDVTLRDLETNKQGVGEIFSKYMTRWKYKASRMVNRPNEKNQINMIIKNLLPIYNSRLLSSPISLFGELCDCGKRIEDALNNG